jgi:Rieske Fe-S protein
MEHDRRTFLRLALVAAALPVGVSACSGGSGASAETFGDVAAGNTSSLTVGSVVAIPGAPAFVARDTKGVYAMTTTCTHQGCDLGTQGRVSASQIECGCHGSVFDTNGGVVRGPAQSALKHFAVTVDAKGEITVHGGQEVGADVRVSV